MKVLAWSFSLLVLAHGLVPELNLGKLRSLPSHGVMDLVSSVPSGYHVENLDLDLCPLCVAFTGDTINILLNIVLNAGIIEGCGKLCALLGEKTGSKTLQVVCDGLCDYVGIKDFIKFIEKADLDPIYYCELIELCPVFDGGDARITQFQVVPESGPQGLFHIDFTYVSQNGTGTGEIVLEIKTVDGIPVESAFLHQKAANGTYPSEVKLKAEPDPSCDPVEEICEMWYPGVYGVKLSICNGECGSSHPHSKIYDQRETNFTITE